MSDTPLPAEEGGRAITCELCGASLEGREVILVAGGLRCFDAYACERTRLQCAGEWSRPASVVSSEEGGREAPMVCTRCGSAETDSLLAMPRDRSARDPFMMTDRRYCYGCDAVYYAASVVGDASEGEAPEIRELIALAKLLENGIQQGKHHIAAHFVRQAIASLRSTRAALEEARAAEQKRREDAGWAELRAFVIRHSGNNAVRAHLLDTLDDLSGSASPVQTPTENGKDA